MPEEYGQDHPQKGIDDSEIDYVNMPIGKLYRRLLPSAIGSLLTATVASFIDVVILSHYLGPGMLAVVGSPVSKGKRMGELYVCFPGIRRNMRSSLGRSRANLRRTN